MMDFKKPFRMIKKEPRMLAPLLILPLVALLLGSLLAYIELEFGDGLLEPEDLWSSALYWASDFQSVSLSIIFGLPDEPVALPDPGELLYYAPGFIGLSEGGFDLELDPEVSGSMILAPVLTLITGWVWAVAGILFMMGLMRVMYIGEYGFREFKRVFTKGNMALASAVSLPVLLLMSGPEGIGPLLGFVLGIFGFLFFAFRSVGNEASVSAVLTFKRLKEAETYLVLLLVLACVFAAASILGLAELAFDSLDWETKQLPEFVLSSLTLIAAVAIQASGAYLILDLASQDPETEVIVRKSIEKARKKVITDPAKLVAEMKAAGVDTGERTARLREVGMSMEEIEKLEDATK